MDSGPNLRYPPHSLWIFYLTAIYNDCQGKNANCIFYLAGRLFCLIFHHDSWFTSNEKKWKWYSVPMMSTGSPFENSNLAQMKILESMKSSEDSFEIFWREALHLCQVKVISQLFHSTQNRVPRTISFFFRFKVFSFLLCWIPGSSCFDTWEVENFLTKWIEFGWSM